MTLVATSTRLRPSKRRIWLLLVLPLVMTAGCNGDTPPRAAPTGLSAAAPEDYAPPAGVTGDSDPRTSTKSGGSTPERSGAAATKRTAANKAAPVAGKPADAAAPARSGNAKTAGAKARGTVAGPARPKVNTDCRGRASSIGQGVAVKGQVPPGFTATTVDCRSMDFQAFTKGRPTMVNFYASWCQPCREEAPHLQAVYEEWNPKTGFLVVGVDTQDEKGSPAAFYDDFGWTFPSVWDDGERILEAWDNKSGVLSTLPVSFFLHRDGTVSSVVIGEMSRSDMESEIRQLR